MVGTGSFPGSGLEGLTPVDAFSSLFQESVPGITAKAVDSDQSDNPNFASYHLDDLERAAKPPWTSVSL